MRNLGDMRFLNDYIGIQWVQGGRDWKGMDCYGLCKMVYKDQYGEILPDWLDNDIDLKGTVDRIGEVVTGGDFEEVEIPQDGDFVICYRTKAAHHMGLYFAGGVLHSSEGQGSIYESLTRFRPKFTKVIFGRWTP